MRRSSSLSRSLSSSSSSSSSSALSDFSGNAEEKHPTNPNNTSSSVFFSKLADTVRDTRFRVEAKKSELNATMQEKLPEWKSRGVMYGHLARETSIEWGRKGKEAVDRWKKERAEREGSSTVSLRTSPSSPSENSIFGMPLEIAVALTRIEDDDLVPAVFRRCIDYLDTYGIHEVGIYRIPGSITTVNRLKAIFDDGSDIDFNVSQPDPHAVGTLLKMYLRELPEPIVPNDIGREYNRLIMELIKSQPIDEKQKEAMESTVSLSSSFARSEDGQLPPISRALLTSLRSITNRLPPYNLSLLQSLCRHLKQVADHEPENRMSISNLALIFIPTLGIGRALFHCMVEYFEEVFGDAPAGPAPPPPLPVRPCQLPTSSKPSPLDGALAGLSLTKSSEQQHSKTRSDTDLLRLPLSPTRVPPPKPSRSPTPKPGTEYFRSPEGSPSTSYHVRQHSEQHSKAMSPELVRETTKPRSKSVSSAPLPFTDRLPVRTTWKRAGSRVEAIGRQFETMINSNSQKSHHG
ncbi:Rho GTPase activation protein [Radiomyces spectabilis]|uniref:Rho GTPase activation protein n=1 Tax=Radiomyces spectabilis TaxID=64574 RepID=UPI00221F631E|nr:Rho GTPase activation protein [Radiomyces spectabilis]KAI8391407.1 Rho GTPase activation protein [Radiomyces spectabilis]